nr:MAG TPA: hypothetical protein [Caudoviricetes sp.]
MLQIRYFAKGSTDRNIPISGLFFRRHKYRH